MQWCNGCKRQLPLEDFEGRRSCSKCRAWHRAHYHVRGGKKRVRDYYIAHRDELLAKRKVYEAPRKRDILDKRRRYRERRPEKILFVQARTRAKRKGLPFAISLADIVVPERCPILGIPLIVGKDKMHDNSPTLDRRVGELGYVPGNVDVISYRANRIKNDGTIEEHEAIIRWMQSRYQKVA
jgi:hypothetical protein